MRYLWLVIFAVFIYMSIIFISQNFDPVMVRFNLDWIGLYLSSKRPLFVPIFVTLATGILFCVAYFFTYHAKLIMSAKFQASEAKRLKRLALMEKEKRQELEQRNSELQQIVDRLQHQIDNSFAASTALPPSSSEPLPPPQESAPPS